MAFKDTLDIIIGVVKSDPQLSASYPTLLKSQSFYENVINVLKGVQAAKTTT